MGGVKKSFLVPTFFVAVWVITGSALAEVAVHRGDEPMAAPSGVTIHRGIYDQDYAAEAPADQHMRHGRPAIRLSAGRNLWIVAPDTGEITACTLNRTGNYRERRIDCWTDYPAVHY